MDVWFQRWSKKILLCLNSGEIITGRKKWNRELGKLCKAVHFLGSGFLNYSLQNHDAISSTFDNSQTNYSKVTVYSWSISNHAFSLFKRNVYGCQFYSIETSPFKCYLTASMNLYQKTITEVSLTIKSILIKKPIFSTFFSYNLCWTFSWNSLLKCIMPFSSLSHVKILCSFDTKCFLVDFCMQISSSPSNSLVIASIKANQICPALFLTNDFLLIAGY